MSKRAKARPLSKWISIFKTALQSLLFVVLVFNISLSWAEESGITDKTIRIGASDPLGGEAKIYGQNLKKGMDAAFTGQIVQKRTIEFEMLDDGYTPEKAIENTKQLIDKGVFAMVGSFGSASTKKVLPTLAEHKIPAFGFYTGAGFTEPGDVLNFRPSSMREVEVMITTALAAGVKPTEICAYVQNDEFGMSGLKGFRVALSKQSGVENIISKLDQLIAMTGDQPTRNNIGPVGVHNRNHWAAADGYLSLKNWEKASGIPCRLVITTAILEPATMFIAYSRYKNEPWIFSALSVVSGDKFSSELSTKGVTGKTEKVITTQVLPSLDATLPIIAEARKALGNDLNYISLEGYVVARLFVEIMKAVNGPLTHEAFLKAAHLQPYDIGGIKVDFTTDNQGSDLVGFTLLKDGLFTSVSTQEMAALFSK